MYCYYLCLIVIAITIPLCVIAYQVGLREKSTKHLELKAGHWYICHTAYCCRADNLTVKEGEKFLCEQDGVVKGFLIKNAEKYFKEIRC